MITLAIYHVRYLDIDDELIFYRPTTNEELGEAYAFRYKNYLEHNYISPNKQKMDCDQYDGNTDQIFHINVKSKKHNALIANLRIITTDPLPIKSECYDILDPFFLRMLGFFSSRKLEIGRLIILPYSENTYLPRHLLLIIMLNHTLSFARARAINIGFAFVKCRLLTKMKFIKLPFFRVKKFKLKYPKDGVLEKYFYEDKDPVVPIYFIRQLVQIYCYIAMMFVKRYVVSVKYDRH